MLFIPNKHHGKYWTLITFSGIVVSLCFIYQFTKEPAPHVADGFPYYDATNRIDILSYEMVITNSDLKEWIAKQTEYIAEQEGEIAKNQWIIEEVEQEDGSEPSRWDLIETIMEQDDIIAEQGDIIADQEAELFMRIWTK